MSGLALLKDLFAASIFIGIALIAVYAPEIRRELHTLACGFLSLACTIVCDLWTLARWVWSRVFG